ncbi:MgtC/SapB family protein [Hyphomicrobium sp.]|uniref:MgtC/SapB family protein n=1 Tax=Hyphomicrobium sp. TaxID=82 RepID=UPI002E3686BA|nr:MgtC/SapB family protein [Hyphomicrobium sp.]HEX2841303.1 MgtC/SapB family protein [Hyphomicrobium sp.]
MNSLELLSPTGSLAHFEVMLRLVMAVALAGLLGWDREEKNLPAGLRTYMLVALAAAVFTVLTFEIFETVRQSSGGNADPIRIIEAVTAGVAFLAAGTIIQGRDSVRGLTTGAGMWMAGALGVAAGAGHYLLAIFAALLSFAILRLVNMLAQSSSQSSTRSVLIDETEADEGSG